MYWWEHCRTGTGSKPHSAVRKALEIARGDDPPDIILLDIMMPGMDGYQVANAPEKGY